MNHNTPATVRTRGLHPSAVANWLVAAYLDRCAAGFGPDGPWCDRWPGVTGPVQTFGFDADSVRLRVVIEPRNLS